MLYTYLTELAGKLDSKAAPSGRTVSWGRLGEHVVKGTCHICHDAAGPRPARDAMLRKGAIPPIKALLPTTRRSLHPEGPQRRASVRGTTVVPLPRTDAGLPLRAGRGMAAAYDFLVDYPPQAAPAQRP